MSLLHYSLYNSSMLDNETEWDLSENLIDGEKINFPSSVIITEDTHFVPPASYQFAGASSLKINSLDLSIKPFTITFWVKPSILSVDAYLFRSELYEISIKISYTNKRLYISGNDTEIVIPDNKFSFVAIKFTNEGTSISIDGTNFIDYTIVGNFINGKYYMLENFSGNLSDFIIHDKLLTLEQVNMLYRSIFLATDSKVMLEYIEQVKPKNNYQSYTDLLNSEKGTFSNNKHTRLHSTSEYVHVSDSEFEVGLFEKSKTLLLNNILTPSVKNIVGTSTNISLPSQNLLEDNLFLFQIDLKLSSSVSNASIYNGSTSRTYSPVYANIVYTLFLIFKTKNKTVGNIVISLPSSQSFQISNERLVNLTECGLEEFFYKEGAVPIINTEGNNYICSQELLNWCETNLKSVNSITLDNDIEITSDIVNGDLTSFVRMNGGASVITENLQEYINI